MTPFREIRLPVYAVMDSTGLWACADQSLRWAIDLFDDVAPVDEGDDPRGAAIVEALHTSVS
jgi:hypothetical protein